MPFAAPTFAGNERVLPALLKVQAKPLDAMLAARCFATNQAVLVCPSRNTLFGNRPSFRD